MEVKRIRTVADAVISKAKDDPSTLYLPMNGPLLTASKPVVTRRLQTYDTTVHPQAERALAATWTWAESVARGETACLILYGETYGAGKTHLARGAAYELALAHWYGNFLSSPDWLAMIKATYNDRTGSDLPLFKMWLEQPWFILDDFGTEHVSPDKLGWLQELLFTLVNGVVVNTRSLLITSNLAPTEFAQRVGGKVFSRLSGLCGKEGFVDMGQIPDYRVRNGVA